MARAGGQDTTPGRSAPLHRTLGGAQEPLRIGDSRTRVAGDPYRHRRTLLGTRSEETQESARRLQRTRQVGLRQEDRELSPWGGLDRVAEPDHVPDPGLDVGRRGQIQDDERRRMAVAQRARQFPAERGLEPDQQSASQTSPGITGARPPPPRIFTMGEAAARTTLPPGCTGRRPP